MQNKNPAKEHYVAMLKTHINLGEEFQNAIDQCRTQYTDEIKRHEFLLKQNKNYAKIFNAYATDREKESKLIAELQEIEQNNQQAEGFIDACKYHAKFFVKTTVSLPLIYQQRRREHNLAKIALNL